MKTKLLIMAGLLALSLPAMATDNTGNISTTEPYTHKMPDGTRMNDADMKPAAAKAKTLPAGHKVVATVNGLVCDYCAQTIRKTLLKEPGVADANVDLSAKTVTVALKDGASLPEARLKTLLKDAGYDLTNYKAE